MVVDEERRVVRFYEIVGGADGGPWEGGFGDDGAVGAVENVPVDMAAGEGREREEVAEFGGRAVLFSGGDDDGEGRVGFADALEDLAGGVAGGEEVVGVEEGAYGG